MDSAMKGFYVVGSSWGVGATTVSVALIRALASRGLGVSAFKPVEVGCSIAEGGGEIDGMPGGELSSEARRAYAKLNELVGPPSIAVSTKTPAASLHPADGERLAAAVGSVTSLARINRYRFSPLVCPALAAKLAERPLELQALQALAHTAAEASDLLVVDGAGGPMEPYGDALLQRHLIAALGLPVVLVGSTERDAINQVLSSLEVLRALDVEVAGVVLNRLNKGPRAEEAAVPLMIEAIAGDIVRGVLPFFSAEQLLDPEFLGVRFATHVDVEALLADAG